MGTGGVIGGLPSEESETEPLPLLTPCPVVESSRPLSPPSPLPAQPLDRLSSGIDYRDLQNGEPRVPSLAGTALGPCHISLK